MDRRFDFHCFWKEHEIISSFFYAFVWTEKSSSCKYLHTHRLYLKFINSFTHPCVKRIFSIFFIALDLLLSSSIFAIQFFQHCHSSDPKSIQFNTFKHQETCRLISGLRGSFYGAVPTKAQWKFFTTKLLLVEQVFSSWEIF